VRCIMPTGGRRFFADSRDATETVKVLRNGDGTGLVAVPAGGSLPAGERRLEFTFRRDNTATMRSRCSTCRGSRRSAIQVTVPPALAC
jgi:hypothetical protein